MCLSATHLFAQNLVECQFFDGLADVVRAASLLVIVFGLTLISALDLQSHLHALLFLLCAELIAHRDDGHGTSVTGL